MKQSTLWMIVGVAILVFIGGLFIGLWAIPVESPPASTDTQTSVEQTQNDTRAIETKISGEKSADLDDEAAETVEDGEKSDDLDDEAAEDKTGEIDPKEPVSDENENKNS